MTRSNIPVEGRIGGISSFSVISYKVLIFVLWHIIWIFVLILLCHHLDRTNADSLDPRSRNELSRSSEFSSSAGQCPQVISIILDNRHDIWKVPLPFFHVYLKLPVVEATVITPIPPHKCTGMHKYRQKYTHKSSFQLLFCDF